MNRGCRFAALLFCLSCVQSLSAEQLSEKLTPPSASLERLRSEDYRTRENAQNELFEWAKHQGEGAIQALLELSSVADDPETGSRCLQVLRELAMQDFGSEGKGYIGIQMQDVPVNVPGDPQPRAGIRIGQIMEDSAAQEAGLLVGDVIIGMGNGVLGDEIWRELPLIEKFGNEIQSLKPKSKVNFKILRGDKVLDIVVELRRRPPIPSLFSQLDEPDWDLDALNKAEQDAYFRNWLRAKKFRK